MQDTSHLMRNLFLIGILSLGAPVGGCTIVDDDDDEPKARIHTDRADDADSDTDDEDVEITVDD